MHAGSAGELGRAHGLEQVGFWRKILEHPSYDAFWQRSGRGPRAGRQQPLKVPVMLVHSLWDQEDIYGAIAVYKAIKPKDTDNDKVFLVHRARGIMARKSATAARSARYDSAATPALYFRRKILRPFLDQYLKDGAPKADVPPVTAFETGTNTWRRLPAWPAGCASGCAIQPTPLYLAAGLKAGFRRPQAGGADFDEYVSDPAKPVPFRARAHSATSKREQPGRSGWWTTSAKPPAAPMSGIRLRRVDRAGKDQRRADRQSDRLHQRHGFAIGSSS